MTESFRRAELAPEPMEQLGRWAVEAGIEPGRDDAAMVLATADARGRPSARVVLLKQLDRRGLVFFSNHDSRKGRELAVNPWAALTMHWNHPRARQVRIEGVVERVSDAESDAYFASRSRESRIGAWASTQSAVIPHREHLERQLSAVRARFETEDVRRPGHWGGYRLRPASVEFWQGRDYRLHDRLRYVREGDGWRVERLAP